MNGAELIAAERERQVTAEGWTPEHDDGHDLGELAMAAAAYACPPGDREYRWFIQAADMGGGTVEIERDEWVRPAVACFPWSAGGAPRNWPFEREGWKPAPDDRVRELVKAGALIAAEIDRLTRAGSATDETPEEEGSEDAAN